MIKDTEISVPRYKVDRYKSEGYIVEGEPEELTDYYEEREKHFTMVKYITQEELDQREKDRLIRIEKNNKNKEINIKYLRSLGTLEPMKDSLQDILSVGDKKLSVFTLMYYKDPIEFKERVHNYVLANE